MLAVVAAFALTASAAAQQPKHQPPVSRVPGSGKMPVSFCFGDGSIAPCPCDNTGVLGRGCENSTLSGGAKLSASGQAVLSADTLQFNVLGEPATSLSLLLQGTAVMRPQPFGDGLLCMGGSVTRLYSQNAFNGAITWPKAGEETISERSAWLGDALVNGSTRCYQVYYRDLRAGFCPEPLGGGFNLSNGVAVVWTR
jgi:hypothetical protein